MANLFKLEFGKVSAMIGKLAEAGMTTEMAEMITKYPEVASALVKSPCLAPPPTNLVHGLFTPIAEQLDAYHEWNSRQNGYAFTDVAFCKARDEAPKTWPEERLVVVTLVPYLDGGDDGLTAEERTFHSLWRQTRNWYGPSIRRWEGLDNPSVNLRVRQGAPPRPARQLRWETIDLGSYLGVAPKDLRNIEELPSVSILAAMAFHPHWLRSMDGESVPYVTLPGYELRKKDPRSGKFEWKNVPLLSSHMNYHQPRTREVCLGWTDMNYGDIAGSKIASPSWH